jgi:hypothetical protein
MIPRVERLGRVIALSFLIPGVITWFYTWALWSGYTYLPHKPIPEEGRIYARGIHGMTVYQTLAERNRLDFLLRTSIVVCAVGFTLAAIEEQRWQRLHPRARPPKNWRS